MTPIRIVLNSTVVNEHELLIQFDSVSYDKESYFDVKDCILQQWNFKEIFYQQHLMQSSMERVEVGNLQQEPVNIDTC